MNPGTHPSSPSRREFLRSGTLGGLGLLACPDVARALALAPARDGARAQAVIHIFLQGGMSHLDTFDPKPLAPVEVRSPFGSVRSALDGEPLGGLLVRTARVADRLAILRSVTHSEAAHERGTHNMLTGYRPSPAITYPSMGSVVAHELGGRKALPAYVCIPDAREPFLGTGYLSTAFAPFSVGGEPAARGFRVRDLAGRPGVGTARLARRRELLEGLNASFEAHSDAVAATEAFYRQAYALIESPSARAAFDLRKEPEALRRRYGLTRMGQRLLLARRLVEAGVRYVTVVDGGWDHHRRIDQGLRARMTETDPAFAALIEDLDQRGLLDRTLVLLTTEFGRTPRINRDRGRDHWPRVFSVVMAGGGIKRGVVHGASSAEGSEVERDPVGPADIAATLFTLMGVDPDKRLLSQGGRPIRIVRDGRVLREILA